MSNAHSLKSPDWIGPLSKAGKFKEPPATIKQEGGIRFPPWAESQYLVRMAADVPEMVKNVILNVPPTDNQRVHQDFIEAALRMPGPIELTIRHGGLTGRTLLAASANLPTLFARRNLTEEEVKSTVTFRVGASEKEITALVKAICGPLFMIFEFAKFQDSVYEHLVTNYIQGRVV